MVADKNIIQKIKKKRGRKPKNKTTTPLIENAETSDKVTVPKKRGRKPKNKVVDVTNTILPGNEPIVPKKKRGRKPKNATVNAVISGSLSSDNKVPKKKRGRKPRGGKIVELKKKTINENEKIQVNCILHLKCSTKDIDELSNSIKLDDKFNIVEPFILNKCKDKTIQYDEIKNDYKEISEMGNGYSEEDNGDGVNLKKIWSKLRKLRYNLHKNDMMDKKSDCFWCTYGFSNPPIYIPKRNRNKTVEVYGCFCSPECAVSYLKNEPIDTATRWERYSLLNNIYCKIYNYNKNIKPAPNPYYTLEKYYGNLSIQEYRKLLMNDRLLLVVDKPLTKLMPELYEESHENPQIYNDILNTSSSNKSKYRLQRKTKKETKKNIMQNKFNINKI
jgi:hypothetical protein